MSRCTCKPYPTIDLTPALIPYLSQQQNTNNNHKHNIHNDNQQHETEVQLKQLRSQVREACQNYGCFHATIDASHDKLPSSLVQLANESQTKQSIESLFHPNLLQTLLGHHHEHTAIKTISVPSCSTSLASTTATNDNNDNSDTNPPSRSVGWEATYRGRSAESGSTHPHPNNKPPTSSTPLHTHTSAAEPKQSWEFRRCTLPTHAQKTRTDNPDHTTPFHLNPLKSFAESLHFVTRLLISAYVVDLPRHAFYHDFHCDCHLGEDASDLQECCIDLLRVFRYDSVADKKERECRLGSSPHTDWGSLTVVWQDSKGGLQIYCHQHKTWNDVELELQSSQPKTSLHQTNNHSIRLFVHVGDFLSLATATSTHPTRDDKRLDHTWPSPRHRVLCPLRLSNHSETRDGVSESSRCSLVYFAYPPPGVSLMDAEHAMSNLKKHAEPIDHSSTDDFPYDRYILLQNQSTKPSTTTTITNMSMAVQPCSPLEISKREYERIRQKPFDSVIRDKWNQVQRD